MDYATTLSSDGLTLCPPAKRPAHLYLHRVAMMAGFCAYVAVLGAAWSVIVALVPDSGAVRLLGHTFALRDIHAKILSNASLVLLILPSVLWLECTIVGWGACSFRQMLFNRTSSLKADMACFLLDQTRVMGLLGRVMMLGVSMISGLWLRDWLRQHLGFSVNPTLLPLSLQVVIYFFAYTFFDYWTHRLGHCRVFWPLHRYHHSAEEFTVINAERIHPAGFAQIFLIVMPMAALGATPQVLVYVNVLTIALGYVIHSKIESDFGWVGRYLVQSPLHHRLHHKLDMTAPTAQFSMAPVWDHLFGTWGEIPGTSVAIGVDTPYRQGFWVIPDLLRDYCHFWAGLVGRRPYSPSEN